MELMLYVQCVIFALCSLTSLECWYVSHDLARSRTISHDVEQGNVYPLAHRTAEIIEWKIPPWIEYKMIFTEQKYETFIEYKYIFTDYKCELLNTNINHWM